jgi:hypothetical protein
MYLLALLVAFGLLGYLVARSQRSSRRREIAAKRTARQTMERVRSRWNDLFSRTSQSDSFWSWAQGPGAHLLPGDFKKWLYGLSDAEVDDFIHNLSTYASTLGFNLNVLVSGGLDQEPIMRQVFVEAIVVYSSAYRKAKLAQQQAEAAEKEKAAKGKSGDGKQPSARHANRRVAEPDQPQGSAEAEGAPAS